jgi:hypothetical protein
MFLKTAGDFTGEPLSPIINLIIKNEKFPMFKKIIPIYKNIWKA